VKQVTSALRAHFGSALTSLATCWKITRRDGRVMGFTDHDQSLTIEGVKYVASSGYYRTAISNSATTSVGNLQVQGFLDDDSISEKELRNGLYDFAEVEIFAVNWADLSMGICRLRYGWFGEVQIRPSGMFQVELRGLMQIFSQTVGETIMPECRADLGDERCKVKLVPDLRRSYATVQAGDRVLIPDNTSDILNYHIPLVNENCDDYQSSNYYKWTLTNGVVANYPLQPRTGVFYIKPTSPFGNARRFLNINMGTVRANSMIDKVDIDFAIWVNHEELGWEVGGLVELTTGDGPTMRIVSSLEIPYEQCSAEDVGKWIRVSRHFTDIDISNSDIRDIRVTVRWRATGSNPNPTGPAKVRLDDPFFEMADYGVFEDEFWNFDRLPITESTATNGWDGSSLRTHPGDVNLMPRYGNFFITSTNWRANNIGGGMRQTYDLTNLSIPTTEIDAGKYVLQANIHVGAFDYGSTHRARFEFLNASNGVVGTADTAQFPIIAGEVAHITHEFPVPANTKKVRVRLYGEVTEVRDDPNDSTTAYDAVYLDLVHIDHAEVRTYVQAGGVEYEATVSGVTGSSVPNVSHTLGEVVQDGTVEWVCVNPRYTFLGHIGSVVNQQTFTVPDIDAPDNWFRWGVLTFLDGDNIGRGIEVLEWNNTTKRMTIMLPALMPIEAGTTIRVASGCDKSRGEGGCKKFSNILNFRGEPEVPGTDQYFKVGGSGR